MIIKPRRTKEKITPAKFKSLIKTLCAGLALACPSVNVGLIIGAVDTALKAEEIKNKQNKGD
jgi:hypothetical protein